MAQIGTVLCFPFILMAAVRIPKTGCSFEENYRESAISPAPMEAALFTIIRL